MFDFALIPITMIMVGCCSNVISLEMIIRQDSSQSQLITFLQFTFVVFISFLTNIHWKRVFLCFYVPNGFLKRKIPMRTYALMVSIFFIVSILNNWALSFNIALPFHMIFRSSSLLSTVVISMLYFKKEFTMKQIISLLMVTIGITMATLSSVPEHKKKITFEETDTASIITFIIGITMLTIAMFLSSVLGLIQENTYKDHGKDCHRETIFYSVDLTASVVANNQSAPLGLDIAYLPILQTMPSQWFYLLINVVTQYICIQGVFILTATCFFALSMAAETPRPTVIWHGMGDTCCYSFSMGAIKKLIEAQIPNIYVKSIEIGDSLEADEFNSFFKPVNEQIDMVCSMLKSDPQLANGFNAIGFSQGGQFLRGYVERCNDPPVYNLISVGGQHQGVYGMPRCEPNSTFCNLAREMAELGVYTDEVQSHLVQAQYWQDPVDYQTYLDKSQFLADINNARPAKNDTYKKNFISLNEFVMVQFTEDTMVIPRESEWFGYYVTGQATKLIPMEQTDLYIQDWIGLQYLDKEGRVTKIPCAGNHLQFTDAWFEQYMIPYMNNTISAI
ncbi:palmitoyl-protein thioesterase 1 [Heterostelium album PN500]|uniref:Palmitoyl-protein thioesterase 1 n=1 Tax=Heterostelium pallidum (strain ATCC 26659 / Pp 5 / PN500) TaxID=670386 RepID=D3BJP6_HETP5|nr:palmitoyl-protein thioesterase 1 [Heterostelium album PN500]EFA78126.1 palmitoyl-protein thioesterase 1 [Heterostelium album PN500]|eukprot:XP_020430252.1 palmitoyl-protein thioesterase 1 [Heterostelium album PN500]